MLSMIWMAGGVGWGGGGKREKKGGETGGEGIGLREG